MVRKAEVRDRPQTFTLVRFRSREYKARTIRRWEIWMSEEIDITYSPSEGEPFMNERQKTYFRAKLATWKNDILREARETLEVLQQENSHHPDLTDRASSETDRAIELRARDRQRKLISKIDAAIAESMREHTATATKPVNRSL